MKKLAVVYPWESPFILSAGVERFLNMQAPPGYEVRWFRGRGWCQARAHNDGFEKALDWGADLICTLDSDQIHPEDMLVRLVERIEGGCDAVSCLVPFRGFASRQKMVPFQKMAWRKVGDGVKVPAVAIDIGDGDLQKIDFIGSGVILFKAEDLKRLKKPWFWDRIEDGERLIRRPGGDVSFVWALQRELGVQMWVDTTIDIKHLHIFEVDETFPERFADWSHPGAGEAAICSYKETA